MLSKGHLDAMRTSLTIHDTLRAGLSQNGLRAGVPHRCPSFSIGALEDDLLIKKLRFTCR